MSDPSDLVERIRILEEALGEISTVCEETHYGSKEEILAQKLERLDYIWRVATNARKLPDWRQIP